MKEEKGQALVEFALVLPIMLLILSLVIFAGFAAVELNRLQMTAQASALAGAGELPDEYAAFSRAEYLAELNGFPEGVEITVEPSIIEVVISKEFEVFLPVPTNNPTLTGRAVYSSYKE